MSLSVFLHFSAFSFFKEKKTKPNGERSYIQDKLTMSKQLQYLVQRQSSPHRRTHRPLTHSLTLRCWRVCFHSPWFSFSSPRSSRACARTCASPCTRTSSVPSPNISGSAHVVCWPLWRSENTNERLIQKVVVVFFSSPRQKNALNY